jgi:DNA-binding CsgD family transcriptional regulator
MAGRKDLSAVTATIEAAAEATVLEELDDAVARLASLLEASNTLLYRFDENHTPQPVLGTLAPAISTYTVDLFQGDPIQRALLDAGKIAEPIVTPRLLGLDPRVVHASAAHTDWYRPHDVEHLLALWIRGEHYGADGMSGILFTRSHREPAFGETELEVMRRTRAAFHAAGRRSQRIEQLTREREAMGAVIAADAARARFALDRSGAIRWMSPAAERLLVTRDGRRLPLPAELHRAASAIHELVGRVEVVLEDGRPFEAELSICRTPSGEPLVAVELHFGGLSVAGHASLCARYGLTRAEAAVANVIALGLSNAEIAARLHVSIETVRTHVQRILGKLAVASRNDAAIIVKAIANE